MKELYKRLYDACVNLPSFKEEAHFVGMKGKLYDENTTRLLLIGRCVNEWESFPAENAQVFGDEANKLIYDTGRFEGWIENIDDVLYSKHVDNSVPKSKR